VTQPLLSILTTCYNDADVLARSVERSLAQTERNIEVLIYNHGSTDDTGEVAEEWRKWDARVRVLLSFRNYGHPYAMNALAQAARAPWCLIVNADDWIEEGYVAEILRVAAADPGVNCIYSALQCFGSQHHVITFPEYVASEAAERHMIPGPRAFRRDLWDALGGEDERWPIGADWDWVVRGSVLGLLKPVYLPHPFYRFYVPPLSAPRLSQQGVDAFPALQRHMRAHTADSARLRPVAA
jgi:glycosyltransferase involved in cell wall biosynthesis